MNFECGNSYNGFILLEENKIDEINSIGRVFKHKKSGARLLFISNEDNNKVFSISFRTPPEDNTGLPHILEHSVLCGSRKFPVKDPFIELAKGSLNTFLNAMTYPDKTMYPIASTNDHDFKNLMDVYLDAVFYPNLHEKSEIMKQEGWHYELNNPEEEINYRGIVYNEMKGAFSSPEQILYRMIQHSLFPDTSYGNESGGDPDYITDLTQEQFTAFHKKYYHPSNSYIYLYGDADVNKTLEWIDENYLSDFNAIDIDSSILIQKPFNETKEVVEEYSIGNNENDKDKTYLSYNVVVGTAENKELHYALPILQYLLLEAPGAPLKKALLDAKIGKDIFGFAENELRQPIFSIVAKNSNLEQKDKFLDVIRNTLKQLVKKGIDKKQIEAAINKVEFKLREADYGTAPKGLIYNLKCMTSWLYDLNPMVRLQYNDTFTKIKSALTSNYFENIIDKYLLNNDHSTVVIVKPKKGLNSIKTKELKQKLAEYKQSLSKQDIDQLVKDTKHLLDYQTEPSKKEDLEKIPLLDLKDIDRNSKKIELSEVDVNNIKLLYHNAFTNEIGYSNFYFNLECIEKDLIPYVGLIKEMLGNLDTKNYSYNALNSEINIHTGGIHFSTDVFDINNEPDKYMPIFKINAKSLFNKSAEMFELIKEIINGTLFDDINRMKEVIAETKSRIQMSMLNAGHSLAIDRAQSYFAPGYAYKDLLKGISFYRFIEDLDENIDDKFNDIKEKLNQVASKIFNKNNLTLNYTGDNQSLAEIKGRFKEFINSLNDDKLEKANLTFDLQRKNEGFATSSKVQYDAKVGNFIKEGYNYSGQLMVMKTIASLDYLWNKIRVKGGAYGCMAGFKRNGNMYFVSYRDPNLKETLEAYDKMDKYLDEFECDDREMTKYIIGTIRNADVPLTPSLEGVVAADRYFMNISFEDIQKVREEILNTDSEKIRKLAPLVKKCMDQDYICVQGNEDKINENKDIFNNTIELFK